MNGKQRRKTRGGADNSLNLRRKNLLFFQQVLWKWAGEGRCHLPRACWGQISLFSSGIRQGAPRNEKNPTLLDGCSTVPKIFGTVCGRHVNFLNLAPGFCGAMGVSLTEPNRAPYFCAQIYRESSAGRVKPGADRAGT